MIIEAQAGTGYSPRLSWTLKILDDGTCSLLLEANSRLGTTDDEHMTFQVPAASVGNVVEVAKANRFPELDESYESLPEEVEVRDGEGRWVALRRVSPHSLGRRLVLRFGTLSKSVTLNSLAYDEQDRARMSEARRDEIRRFMRVWDAIEELIQRDDILRFAKSDADFGA